MKKPKTYRAILIDPFACQISEVTISRHDLETYYQHLSHESMPVRRFEVARHPALLAGRDAVFFDEEGTFKECERLFILKGFHTPILGNGLIVGADDSGNTADAATPMVTILRNARYLVRTPAGLAVTTVPWERDPDDTVH